MTDTVIIKRKLVSNFTTLPNELIRDANISWGALGLLVYILSLPNDFKLRLSHLSNQKSCGRDATRARAKELVAAGYLSITRERGGHGRFSNTLWEASDTPEFGRIPPDTPPRSGFPYTENPTTVLPYTENPTLLNTDTKQERSETNTTTTKPMTNEQPRTHDELDYPNGTPKGDIPAIAKALSAVPVQDAQALLDELAGALSKAGAIKTTPARWFFGLLKKYESGQFNATNKKLSKDRKERELESKAPKTTPEEALAYAIALKLRNSRKVKY